MEKNDSLFEIRRAVPGDEALLLGFIRELADYEKMLDQVTATEALLTEWLFERGTAQALIALESGVPVGFALYFYNFSTFLGRAGLYLEDMYIRPAYRRRGYGKKLFIHLAGVAKAEGCGRFEWSCLDWNTPALAFYRTMGAVAMDEWTVHRLDGEGIERLAGQM